MLSETEVECVCVRTSEILAPNTALPGAVIKAVSGPFCNLSSVKAAAQHCSQDVLASSQQLINGTVSPLGFPSLSLHC